MCSDYNLLYIHFFLYTVVGPFLLLVRNCSFIFENRLNCVFGFIVFQAIVHLAVLNVCCFTVAGCCGFFRFDFACFVSFCFGMGFGLGAGALIHFMLCITCLNPICRCSTFFYVFMRLALRSISLDSILLYFVYCVCVYVLYIFLCAITLYIIHKVDSIKTIDGK